MVIGVGDGVDACDAGIGSLMNSDCAKLGQGKPQEGSQNLALILKLISPGEVKKHKTVTSSVSIFPAGCELFQFASFCKLVLSNWSKHPDVSFPLYPTQISIDLAENPFIFGIATRKADVPLRRLNPASDATGVGGIGITFTS